MPGDRLEYYKGFLIVDAFPPSGWPPSAFQQALAQLRARAFRAAELGLVHLIQQRLGDECFSYVAIARPQARNVEDALSTLLLEQAAA
jgi:hypothetical protein